MKQGTRKILAWTFGILSGVSLLLAAAGGVTLAYQGKIAPNTYVGGVAVGGLTTQQAVAAVTEKAGQVSAQAIVLEVDGQEQSASVDELGIVLLPQAAEAIVAQSATPFSWLAPSHWLNLFTKKASPISYELDEQKFRSTVENKFGLHSTAKNAELLIEKGQLVISEAASGKKIDISSAIASLDSQLATGQAAKLAFTYSETNADISTEQATQTKAEIEAVLQPLKLTGGERNFTISIADQLTFIDYPQTGNDLSWQVSEEKLRNYLEKTIASRLNIKMIQRTFQIKPEALLQEGKDGRAVVMSQLVPVVYRTITEQGTRKVIEIPLQTIAFTDKWVEAEYIPGLFPGIYVDINLAKQRLHIVNGETLVSTFIISSGKAGLPTPKGVFYIKNKIDIAQSRLYPGIWMRYWNALAKNPDGSGYEGYGIHDLPCFNYSCTLIEGAGHLGRPVSHGCVRLGHENAVWFYENIPIATPVNIH